MVKDFLGGEPISEPEAIRIESVEPETRLDLLERVNRLNILGYSNGECYWTVTVMYNTVILRRSRFGTETMYEVIEGIPK